MFHYLGGTARKLGATTFGVGGTADHVHMLIGLKTTHTVADLMREIKKSSSNWAVTKRPDFAWQSGYGAFGIRASEIPSVLNYIVRQEEHHRRISAVDELRMLLAEFEVAYNEEFFD
jgi:REP element-mobilizing transposase RayT